MLTKRKVLDGLFIFFVILTFIYKSNDCQNNEETIVLYSCRILGESSYNVLNSFCDSQIEWSEVSELLKKDPYCKISSTGRNLPSFYWGTDRSLCGDETQVDELNVKEVILNLEKDTSMASYNGALKSLFFKDECSFDYRFKKAKKHLIKKVYALTPSEVNVDFIIEKDEVNIKILAKFRGAVFLNSTYAIKHSVANYRLVSKISKKSLATIRCVDYGKRFYFDVSEPGKK